MARPPKIIVLSEQLRGQSFELTEPQHTIGRVEDCDICIPDPTVSSLHCTMIRMDDGDYVVRDESSTNGTRLNGVRLEGQSQPLVNSDILQIGGVEMFFDCDESHTASAVSTQTVINLEDSQTGVPVSEMTNFSPFERAGGDNKKTVILLGSIIGLLLAAVIVSLVVLLIRLM